MNEYEQGRQIRLIYQNLYLIEFANVFLILKKFYICLMAYDLEFEDRMLDKCLILYSVSAVLTFMLSSFHLPVYPLVIMTVIRYKIQIKLLIA